MTKAQEEAETDSKAGGKKIWDSLWRRLPPSQRPDKRPVEEREEKEEGESLLFIEVGFLSYPTQQVMLCLSEGVKEQVVGRREGSLLKKT